MTFEMGFLIENLTCCFDIPSKGIKYLTFARGIIRIALALIFQFDIYILLNAIYKYICIHIYFQLSFQERSFPKLSFRINLIRLKIELKRTIRFFVMYVYIIIFIEAFHQN